LSVQAWSEGVLSIWVKPLADATPKKSSDAAAPVARVAVALLNLGSHTVDMQLEFRRHLPALSAPWERDPPPPPRSRGRGAAAAGCVDKEANCKAWAANGECVKNPGACVGCSGRLDCQKTQAAQVACKFLAVVVL
jgi:hypothetical protein